MSSKKETRWCYYHRTFNKENDDMLDGYRDKIVVRLMHVLLHRDDIIYWCANDVQCRTRKRKTQTRTRRRNHKHPETAWDAVKIIALSEERRRRS